jgi:ribosomal protein L37AE/L43A
VKQPTCCGNCHHTEIERQSIQGREVPWGRGVAIVKKDTLFWVCQHCGELTLQGRQDFNLLVNAVEDAPCSAVG